MATLRAQGLAAVDGDLVLDRSFFAPAAHDPAAFDGEPLKPYNVGPDALLVNFKSVQASASRPPTAGDASGVGVEPALAERRGRRAAAPRRRRLRRLARRRSARRSSTAGTRAEAPFAGRYPASCGEREWWVSLLDHPTYVHGMFDTYFRAAGGRFAGGWKNGVAPRDASAVRDARVAAAVGHRPRRQQAVEQRDGAAAVPDARHRRARRRRRPPPARRTPCCAGSRGASSGCRSSCSRTAPDSRAASASAPAAWRACCVAADASAVREEFASSLAVAAMDGTRAAPVPERHRRRAGAAQDRDARRRARARGLRDRPRRAGASSWSRSSITPNAARAQGALDYLVQWVYQYGATWAPPSALTGAQGAGCTFPGSACCP